MKKLVVSVIFLAAFVLPCGRLLAAGPARDASDLFLRAYLQIQEGDSAFDKGDYTGAQTRYKDALAILKDIETVQPDWNAHIIKFRTKYCDQRITEAKVRLAGGPAPAPAKSEPPPPPPATASSTPKPSTFEPPKPAAPTTTAEASRELTSEVERLREQVRRMQAERAAASAITAAPAAPAAPVVTTPPPAVAPTTAPPVTAEGERVKKLEAELSDMRKQFQEFMGEKNQSLQPMPLPSGDTQRMQEMSDRLATLRSQLQQLLAERSQWEQSRQDLARLQSERASLLSQLQEKDQRLAAGPSAIDASQAKTLSEQLAQSARTIQALRSESKQLAIDLNAAQKEARDQAAKATQLAALPEQLTTSKSEVEKLRKELTDRQQTIATRNQEVTRAQEQIQTLKTQLAATHGSDKEIAMLREELANKQKALAAQTQEIARAQQEAQNGAAAQQTNAILRISIDKAQSVVAQRKAREQELSTQLDQLKQQLQDYKTRMAASQDNDKALAKLREELAAKEKTLAIQSQETTRAQQQLQDIKAQLAAAQSNEKEIARLREDLAAKQKILGTQSQESARTQQQLLDMKVELAKAKGSESELAKVREQLAAKAREASQAQVPSQDLAALKRADASLRLSMSKADALATVALAREQESAKQLDLLKQLVKDLQAQLAEARQAKPRTSAPEPADRARTAQLDTMKQKLEEAERRLSAASEDRAMLARERDVLRLAVDKKTAELQKLADDSTGDRKKVTSLEKHIVDLNRQVTALELTSRRLMPDEEAFLKKTEVLVQPSTGGVNGEITANVRRAKERALAQVAALDSNARIPSRPAPQYAQAPASPDAGRVASDASNTSARPAPATPAAAPDTRTPATSSPSQLPPDLKPLVDEARDLYNQKKFDEAAAKYREILKRDPDNLFGLSNLAIIRFQQERLEEAEHLLNRALQIAPNDAFSHATIGVIYFKMNRIDEALDELGLAIKLNRNNPEAHNYYGMACAKKGWHSAAVNALYNAIQINPNYADAHFNLAIIFAEKQKDLAIARFHYRKALDLGRPRDPNLERVLTGTP